MKKPHAVLVFLAAAWCSPLLAQTRISEKGPRTEPSSLFDAVGFNAPEIPLTKKCSNSDEAPFSSLRAEATRLPQAAVTTAMSSLPPGLWASDSLSTAVRPAQYPSFSSLFSETFTSGLASTRVFINLWAWVSVPTTTSGIRDGVFLSCTVTQGSTITACPGTSNGPALLTQVSPAASGPGGQGLSIQGSYIGAVSISANTSTTVDIKITALTSALTTTASVNTTTLLLQY